MPYLNLLVENLHTYVDDFLQYAIQSLAKSHSLESMCLELFAQECEFMEQFQRGKEKVDWIGKVLVYVPPLSLPFLLIANFSRILINEEGYKKQLLRNGLASLGIFVAIRSVISSTLIL